MHIVETFPAPETKAGRLFWLPSYVRLSQEVYKGYLKTGEISEAHRHVGNCASRWGISRACSEAMLNGTAGYDVTDLFITISRPVTEE